MMTDINVTIVGGGMIGRGWIIAFARAGMRTTVWSRNPETSQSAIAFIHDVLPWLEAEGLLSGRTAIDVAENVHIENDLETALAGTDYVQENAPEDIDSKLALFEFLDANTPEQAIIASSTSAILPSAFMADLRGRARCLVAHPMNPPYLMPATELVPSPWTSIETLDRAREIMTAAGQKPIIVHKEIEGFIINRLQGAVLNEAFALVGGGYASADDVDLAIKDGLALRWSFMGPFETIDLNAPGGVGDYVARYNALYANLHAQMRDRTDWAGPILNVVETGRRAQLPVTGLTERQIWRDRRLMALAAHKRDANDRFGC